ncbi:MAG: YeeE/YedE family protein [Rhodospirillaceae bacterium]|nr:YeeE/YedE family protein [Rhodospirillaceae bacterium]
MSVASGATGPGIGLLAAAGAGAAALALEVGWRQGALFVVALLLGITLYQSRFAFSGSYRALLTRGRVDGVRAQALMIGVATPMFASLLWAGEAWGWEVRGAVAPVGLPVVIGAFIFGVGMQLGGGCGSGTLLALGGGSLRMGITLAAFCFGGFWATLHWPFWIALPSAGPVVLGERFGWAAAAAGQMLAMAMIWRGLRRWDGVPPRTGERRRGRLRFPWSLATGATLLALLNVATLALSGGPWSITWGFTLVAAKLARLAGWDPDAHVFWQADFQSSALASPLVDDVVAVMDVGVVLGAAIAAVAAGRMMAPGPIPPGAFAASVAGGLLLGYGARISFGCNIGAFFSGAASTSLHGWIWLAAALAGNWAGVRLRPRFGLDG